MKPKNDNPKAFKNWINPQVVKKISQSLIDVGAPQKVSKLNDISSDLSELELKDRVRLISDTLFKVFDQKYSFALDYMIKSLNTNKLKSFDLWPYTQFVQTYGLRDLKISLEALYVFTQHFTSEFAVRPFLKKYEKQTLDFLLKCTKDKNVHVRRWSSEGSRPRLPWGEKLENIILKPELTLPLLEGLKFDDELYVRKSVANHLNDITKDNPKIVIKLLKRWLKTSPKIHSEKIFWITKHALRGLIKAGDKEALELIGVSQNINIQTENLKLNKKNYKLGDTVQFSFEIKSQEKITKKLVIDYLVYHQKSNGTQTAKVFKLKTLVIEPNQSLTLSKKHSLRPVTTRTYYSGLHAIEIQINGQKYLKKSWVLNTN